MRNTFRLFVLFAAISTPLWAARKASITIPQDVSVGSTHIGAGDYKVSFDGPGPDVKVTLTKSGTAPIVLDARLQKGARGPSMAMIVTKQGARFLKEIDLDGAVLVLDEDARAAQ